MPSRALHIVGVLSGLAAGAWLGAAEAPTKLVTLGISPFLISLGMVAGVFVARWTIPTLMKGTGYVFADLRSKAHLIVWAVVAGALWAVANTLTVFAIRDVGLSIAFPLWNVNCLVGIFWGWFFFRELRGAGGKEQAKVLGGAVGIAGGAVVLAYASTQAPAAVSSHAAAGILAALGAGLLWGTMYIPYRKAYLSGMNPLSFVTVFTVGELGTVAALALVFRGGLQPVLLELGKARPALFWLFLGGFCWVLGDLFQQYATKYIGIGRGIPLSNTNQLWGLAWGVLVFGELAGRSAAAETTVIAGSLVMILGAASISSAVAPAAEQASWGEAVERECARYQLDRDQVFRAQAGEDTMAAGTRGWRWWDAVIVVAAVGIFAWLARGAQRPAIAIHAGWIAPLLTGTFLLLAAGAVLLWKHTRFS